MLNLPGIETCSVEQVVEKLKLKHQEKKVGFKTAQGIIVPILGVSEIDGNIVLEMEDEVQGQT